MTAPTPVARDARPAAWPMLLALLLAPAAVALALSLAVAIAVIFASPPGSGEELSVRCQAWIAAHTGSLTGVLVLLLPSQAAILAVAFFLSRSSEGGLLSRLGFGRGRASAGTIALAVLGTLGVQWASSIAFELSRVEPSPHIKELWRMLSVPGRGAVLTGGLLSVVPAICEEALFRGVGQRRLLERWPPLAAIGAASALFAFGHLDVQQSLMVFPLGLWFGFVAWKTGSARASAACHAANNLAAILCGRIWGDPETGSLPHTWPFVAAGIALCACIVFASRSLARALVHNGSAAG